MFCWLLRIFCNCQGVDRLRLYVTAEIEDGIKVAGENVMLRLTTVQRCKLKMAALDDVGNTVNIDTKDYAPVWRSTDETVATVQVDQDDPTRAYVVAVGVGTAQIKGDVDADLDAGEIRSLPAWIDVEVVPAEAVALLIETDGDPEVIPPG